MTRDRWRGRITASTATRFLSLHCDLVLELDTVVDPVLPAVAVADAPLVLAPPVAVAVAEPEGKDALPVMGSVVPTRVPARLEIGGPCNT